MKKHVIKLDKSFSFDKEIITKLSDAQLSGLVGGKGAANQNETDTTTFPASAYHCSGACDECRY